MKEQSKQTNSGIGHDIKNSYINNLHMKSSLMYLYIISSIIPFLNKIPYIKRLIGLIAAIYGRTTIWKIIVRIRKIFIIINSLIGIYLVFKTTGFSHESLYANFVALGNNYIEIFANITKRLFNWFLDLFGYDIVPNKPNTPNNNLFKYNNPLDFYNPSTHKNNPLDLENNKLSSFKSDLFKPHNINIYTTSSIY